MLVFANKSSRFRLQHEVTKSQWIGCVVTVRAARRSQVFGLTGNRILSEGTGHAGVGSVFDLSNARVAKLLKCKVILVTTGGIGKPIDEVALNKALFDKEGVELVGVILNKVLPGRLDYIAEFARRGFERLGIDLLGVIPQETILANQERIRELEARLSRLTP